MELWQEKHKRTIAVIFVTAVTFYIFRRWMAGPRCRSRAQLHGKTVIITGANAGIGKETARDLARRGARVIMACRSTERGTDAANDIENDSRGEIVVRHLDLNSFKSVREFVKEILESERRLDILINNAGLIYHKEKTEDGFDVQLQTNHLGHFLLTNLLLDKLKATGHGRIINVSSFLHKHGKMNWNDLNFDKSPKYDAFMAYYQTKLANILFTKELTRRLKGININVYCLHPGVVRTNFTSNIYQATSFKVGLFYDVVLTLFCKNSEEGAQTTIYCAVSEEVENQSGLYYSDCMVKTPAPQALDEEAAKKLWDLSLNMVGLQE